LDDRHDDTKPWLPDSSEFTECQNDTSLILIDDLDAAEDKDDDCDY
jgi:hypothetical protein